MPADALYRRPPARHRAKVVDRSERNPVSLTGVPVRDTPTRPDETAGQDGSKDTRTGSDGHPRVPCTRDDPVTATRAPDCRTRLTHRPVLGERSVLSQPRRPKRYRPGALATRARRSRGDRRRDRGRPARCRHRPASPGPEAGPRDLAARGRRSDTAGGHILRHLPSAGRRAPRNCRDPRGVRIRRGRIALAALVIYLKGFQRCCHRTGVLRRWRAGHVGTGGGRRCPTRPPWSVRRSEDLTTARGASASVA